MAKLVVLTQSLAGRSYDLATERTTVGRVEDNAFQISEPSVSSHHCEILLRGDEIVIKDLNSTNGTFINGEKITEGVLKPGQTLRLGNIELKLDVPGAPTPAPAASPAPAAPPPPPASPKKETAKATAGGVSMSDLESGGRAGGFDTKNVFTKKKKGNAMYFWIGAGVVMLVIIILIIVLITKVSGQ
jgi:hypothetical protein